jgi:hypothetical protein
MVFIRLPSYVEGGSFQYCFVFFPSNTASARRLLRRNSNSHALADATRFNPLNDTIAIRNQAVPYKRAWLRLLAFHLLYRIG